MGNHGNKSRLTMALMAIGAYVVFSLITYIALTVIGVHSLGGAFTMTALWMGGLGWIIWRDMR